MARIFLDEIGGLNSSILGSYGLPMSPFSTEDYSAPVTETEVRPARTRRKQSKPKPKRNDGIIRNHDSVWDYKIQDGKLLTRRKKGNGNWIDISNNEEAVNKLENFTGKNIGQTKTQSATKAVKTPEGGPFGGKNYSELTAILDNAYPKTSEQNKKQTNNSIKTTEGISDKGPIRNEFTEPYLRSEENKQWFAKNIPRVPIGYNAINRHIGESIPALGHSIFDQVWKNKVSPGVYLDLMNSLGINPMLIGNERYYPMV